MGAKQELHDKIHENMQLKSTAELLEIWQQNDRETWSQAALDAVKKIIKQRTGKAPDRSKKPGPNLGSAANDELDTFYDLAGVAKIASLADAAAWIILIGNVLAWSLSVYQNLPAQNTQNAGVLIATLAASGLSRLLTAFYLFVLLKAIAQVIYVLVDIEQNTRDLVNFEKSKRKRQP